MNLPSYIDFFKLSFDEFSQVVFLLDPKTQKILTCNITALDLYNYSQEEITSLPISKMNILPENIINKKMTDILDGKLKSFEFTKENKDNFLIYYKVIVNRVSIESDFYLLFIIESTEKCANIVGTSTEKDLEQKVLESDSRWRQAIDSTGAGLWDWNLTTNEVYISSSWKSMLGYEDHEIENNLNEWEKRVHPDDLDYAYSEINKHLNGEHKVYSSEHRMMCKDGSYIWVHDKGKILEWNAEGKPTRMIGMHFDIDKLKSIELELKKSEEKYKALFHLIPIGVTYNDNDGNIMEANSVASEILGLSADQITKRKYDDEEWKVVRLDGSEMLPEEYASVRAIKEQRTIKNIEMGVKKGKDDFAWINVNATPIKDGAIVSFEDINDRLNSQKLLKESESNFRTFFESMDDIIVVADLNGFLITNNTTINVKLGFNNDELKGKHILDLHQPEKVDEAKQILTDMFGGLRDFCPLPLRKKDGSLLPVETRVWMGKWNGQDCLYGVSKDISKQQSALEKFERLFKNNPAIMTLSNLELGTYIDVNDSFTKILGYQKAEAVGKNAFELGLFKNWEQREYILSKLLQNGRFSNEIVEICDKTGNIKYGNFSGEIIDNQGEKILLTVMIDVTEEIFQRHEIESFFSVSLDLLCITDMECKLLKVNDAWENFLHVPKERIVNSYLGNYIHKDDIENSYSALAILNKGESLLSYVNRLHSDALGGERYFEWRAIPVGNRVYAAGRDITDRIIRESEVNDLLEQIIESKDIIEATLYQKNALIDEIEQSKQKLEENIDEKNSLINQLEETKLLLEHNIEEKEKFFSIIAHDLKSPFSGFLGLTKILSEEIYDLSMREMQEFASSLKHSADNLYKLLENLLEWSRVKRGLVGFKPQSIKLNDVINENLEIIKSKASLKDIILNNYVKDYIHVYADENMLNAVVRNLLANSLKFTPHHGKVVIDALADEQKVLVSVQDSGIGMPPEILSKLFTIGEKVSRPGTDGEPSTGLGLALCKEYIDKHHGKIWAESHLNHGSTFYFTLKLK